MNLAQTLSLRFEALDAVGRDVVGAPRGPYIRGLPFRTDEALPLETTERAIHPARVAITVVHRAQTGSELIAVVGLLPQQQEQTRLQEIPWFKLRHEGSSSPALVNA